MWACGGVGVVDKGPVGGAFKKDAQILFDFYETAAPAVVEVCMYVCMNVCICTGVGVCAWV